MSEGNAWIDSLMAEHSVWEVFRKSPRFWTNRFNLSTVCVVLLLLACFAFLHFSPPPWASSLSNYSLNDTIISWAGQGITFTVTMLGFLLAGFTVFSTLTKPQLLAELAQVPHKLNKGREHDSSLSELKFIFFNFINIFVHYICFLALSASIILFGTKDGPLVFCGEIVKRVSTPQLFDLLQHVFFVFMGAWFALLLLKLKSFIWNMYQMVLVVIAAESTQAGS